MAMSKAGSSLAGPQKDKQRAYEHPLTNARTVSCDGDSTKIRPLHYNTAFKPRYSDQAGKSDMTDRSNPPDDLPQLTLNEDNEPPPPPEITSASVMAVTRLKNTMSDLLDAINYYEEFDRICHGTYICNSMANPISFQRKRSDTDLHVEDTPAWSYSVGQQTRDIRSSLRCIRQAAAYILYLRDGGQGTVGRGQLEGLVKEVFAIEKEAKMEWKGISASFAQKSGEKVEEEKKAEEEKVRLREEHVKAYHRFIEETYVKKMKSCLGQLEAAKGEIETMKRELRTAWEELSKMTVKELDEMEERY